MISNPVGWFEIYVRDIARAKIFYEFVFQVQLERLDSCPLEMWGFPQVAGGTGASGALVKAVDASFGGGGTVVYFICMDCAIEAARAVKAGGKIVRERFGIGRYGFIALVTDTEGNLIGLHSRQ